MLWNVDFKHLLVHIRNLRSCPKPGKGLFYTHALYNILREIRPSAAEAPPAPPDLHLILRSGEKKREDFNEVHLAWRYGLTIEPNNEKEIMDWLRKVDKLISDRRKKL